MAKDKKKVDADSGKDKSKSASKIAEMLGSNEATRPSGESATNGEPSILSDAEGIDEAHTELTEHELDAKELHAEVQRLSKALHESQERFVRAQAEAENIQRRLERDISKAHKFGIEKFINELLPVIDSLERGLEIGDSEDVTPDSAIKSMREGIELTLQMFHSALAKFEVKAVSPEGEIFDPAFHEAMSMQEQGDVTPNTVLAVLQKGYTIHGRLIRPAMVIVARAASNPKADESA